MLIRYLKLQKKIKLVLLDVDGVMTDEGIYYDNTHREYKKFNARDGFGIEAAINAGIKIALIFLIIIPVLFFSCSRKQQDVRRIDTNSDKKAQELSDTEIYDFSYK